MEHEGGSALLHQRISGALARAAQAQEDSRVLIAECRVASVALRETLDATRRARAARIAAPPDK